MNTMQLLTGYYSPADAQDLLLSVIKAKINVLNIQNLRVDIRYGLSDPQTDQQIEALKNAKDQILASVQQARKNNSRLRIESTISIAVVEALEEEEAHDHKVCSKAEAY